MAEIWVMPKVQGAGIRVLLVDDHPAVREALRAVLSVVPEISVVGEAENGLLALDAVATLKPDVVVTDIEMPELNGLEATRRIRQHFPLVEVVIVTVHENRTLHEEGMRAGAAGYLLKRDAARNLAPAIQAAMQHQAL